MRNYVDRAMDFIEQIYPFIKDDLLNPYTLHKGIDAFNERYSRKVKYFHGCARIALLTSDYVIKYDYDEEEVACLGGCKDEVRLYEWASEQGFGYLFAEITPTEYDGHIFYIMPRIRGIGTGRYRAWHYLTPAETEFCTSNSITDLHINNYGFRKGKVCIVDYACQSGCGYRESSDESGWS